MTIHSVVNAAIAYLPLVLIFVRILIKLHKMYETIQNNQKEIENLKNEIGESKEDIVLLRQENILIKSRCEFCLQSIHDNQ